MVGILLVSHGEFATGILHSIGMLFPGEKNMEAVSLMPGMKGEELRAKLEEAVSRFDDPENVFIMADLWGGSPFKQAKELYEEHKDHWAVVTGLNFPMLIEAVVSRMFETNAQKVAASILKSAKNGIRILPEEE